MDWNKIKEALLSVADRSLEPAEAAPWWSSLIALSLALAVVLTPPIWKLFRNTVTLVHEYGHAIAGASVGRRLSGVKLHQDTSGATVTYGRTGLIGWLTGKYTAAMGYPFPAIVGLLLLLSVSLAYPRFALSVIFIFLLILLPFIRNLHSLGVLLLHLLGVGLAAMWGPDAILQFLLTAIGFFLVAGGFRSILELYETHRRGDKTGSDVHVLSLGVPLFEFIWFMVYFVFSLSSVGASLYLIFGGVFNG